MTGKTNLWEGWKPGGAEKAISAGVGEDGVFRIVMETRKTREREELFTSEEEDGKSNL